MNSTIEFFVPGIPAPGGSKNAFVPTNRKTGQPFRGKGGRIIVNVVDAGGEKTKLWRKAVAWSAKHAMMGEEPHGGPVICHFEFRMPRPKDHFRSNGLLKPTAPAFHLGTPDTLKLARSTEDAMTKIVWLDDKQVIEQKATKEYTRGESGCYIKLEFIKLPEEPTLL